MNESQIKLINIKIREYFRYIRNEYKSIREYYDIYDNAKNQYLKSYIKLIDTKEYLFNNEDIENWGINKEDIIDRRILLKNKEYSFSKMMPDELKEEHAPRAEELNFAPSSDYMKVVNIYKKGVAGKEIDDEVQDILTHNELLDSAVNLVADYAKSISEQSKNGAKVWKIFM